MKKTLNLKTLKIDFYESIIKNNKMNYDLELEKAIAEIKKTKAKKVLIQLPDGLKPQATEIVDKLEDATGTTCLIWAGSCFGSCDVPNVKGIDLLIQFGHSKSGWKKQKLK